MTTPRLMTAAEIDAARALLDADPKARCRSCGGFGINAEWKTCADCAGACTRALELAVARGDAVRALLDHCVSLALLSLTGATADAWRDVIPAVMPDPAGNLFTRADWWTSEIGWQVMKPGGMAEIVADGHRIRATALKTVGIHTGRTRFLMHCMSCDLLLHEATTGPRWAIQSHIAKAGKRQ